jgi:hypothetical protein
MCESNIIYGLVLCMSVLALYTDGTRLAEFLEKEAFEDRGL